MDTINSNIAQKQIEKQKNKQKFNQLDGKQQLLNKIKEIRQSWGNRRN